MTQEYYTVNVPGEELYDLQEPIQVRKITPIEQKKLVSLMGRENTTNREIIGFINTLIKGIDPMQLYWPDYYFILYQMRLITYKMFPLEGTFLCDKCEHEQKVQIDITQLPIDEVPGTYTKNSTVYLENFGDVPFRYKKVIDDITVEDFMKRKGLDKNDIDMRTLIYALLLLSNWKPIDELWDLAESGEITMQDMIVIDNLATKSVWGVREEIKFICDKCGEEVSSTYEMQLDGFFPSNFN